MKHFWNWTVKFIVVALSLTVSAFISLSFLDVRDHIVLSPTEDPIWEFIVIILLIASLTALFSTLLEGIIKWIKNYFED